MLAARGHQVTGIDPEVQCVAASSVYADCRQGSVEDVPRLFRAREFDVIVSSHVLEHLVAPIDAMACLRAMKAAAYVFAVPNVHRPARLLRLLAGSARPDHPAHVHGWGRPEFAAALETAGFCGLRWSCDRVTINPLQGKVGAAISRVLKPIETRLLPRLFPQLSSSLIVTCHAKGS